MARHTVYGSHCVTLVTVGITAKKKKEEREEERTREGKNYESGSEREITAQKISRSLREKLFHARLLLQLTMKLALIFARTGANVELRCAFQRKTSIHNE